MMTTTDGQIFMLAPPQTAPITTGTLQGVWVLPQQEVEWIWTHAPSGSYVSGYTIKDKDIDIILKEVNDGI